MTELVVKKPLGMAYKLFKNKGWLGRSPGVGIAKYKLDNITGDFNLFLEYKKKRILANADRIRNLANSKGWVDKNKKNIDIYYIPEVILLINGLGSNLLKSK